MAKRKNINPEWEAIQARIYGHTVKMEEAARQDTTTRIGFIKTDTIEITPELQNKREAWANITREK